MFLSCSFIHPFIPGSGFGGSGVGFGVGFGAGGVGLGVGVGAGGTIDLAAERILLRIIPIAKPKAVITDVITDVIHETKFEFVRPKSYPGLASCLLSV